jgi:hypothetical protein
MLASDPQEVMQIDFLSGMNKEDDFSGEIMKSLRVSNKTSE